MSNIPNDIKELINTTGKAAPHMTHAFKNIGNGDMQRGVKRFADYLFKEGCDQGIGQGFKMGEKSGWVKGSLTTLGVISLAIGGGLYIKDRYEAYKSKKALEEEGKEILDAIKSSVLEEKANIETLDEDTKEPTDNSEENQTTF